MLRHVEGCMGAPQMQQRSLLAACWQGFAEGSGGIGQMVCVQPQERARLGWWSLQRNSTAIATL